MSSSRKRDRRDEVTERERNRDRTLKRSRMWQTVDSDQSSVNDSGSDSEGSYSERSRSQESSGSSERGHRSKSKKDKKEKKKKKDKKHKHKKHKHKKDKKESKGAIDQNEYGAYGIIKEEHFFQKQREFEVYMEEVKKMPGILGQSRREVMEYFKCYMEDYNTATMPHEKYYNYEKWEMAEYQKKQEKKRKKSSKQVQEVFDDEADRQREARERKERDEKREFAETLSKIAQDREMREGMRRQGELKAELQLAYRQGDMATVKRIEKMLAPESEGPAVKHPWA
mmetsp:Transcript_14717/g.22199  ORF Transcript_14717/g.22199 Transcript_14717/m.22199 type:complete len:283 (+) Transcript_14717:131-979(+)|eukprot:CAMPEP_0185026234 /NCGR_PEP_ID=MMETSP1103-20130426/10172_1 /TAXON_ID=36769 /ORGANISM="Paraphysomonas bandaiensis, Strain Caron Lab Isolate" /LENGTH=282 /DNA_ID=CAMNT_0027559741 /DNA_START=51 /DNA_END=899 /DNA_ORIENTATION=+